MMYLIAVMLIAVLSIEPAEGTPTQDFNQCFMDLGSKVLSELPDFRKIFNGGVPKAELEELCPGVQTLVACLTNITSKFRDNVAYIGHACADNNTMSGYVAFEQCVTTNAAELILDTHACIYQAGRMDSGSSTDRCRVYSRENSCWYSNVLGVCGSGAAIYAPLWFNQTASSLGLPCRFTPNTM